MLFVKSLTEFQLTVMLQSMKLLLTSLLLLSPLLTHAAPTFGNLPVTQLHEVIDGDTIKVTIGSVHPLLGDRIKIRVKDIDTPEISDWKYGYKCQQELELGLEAKRVAEEFLEDAESVELRNVSRGKYFRIAADVYVGDRNLSDVLLEQGLAHVYLGGRGKKQSWCE